MVSMSRYSIGERCGGRQRGTPNKSTTMFAAAASQSVAARPLVTLQHVTLSQRDTVTLFRIRATSGFSSPYMYAGSPRKLEERRRIRDHAIDAVLCIVLAKIPTRNGPDHCRGIGCLGCFEKRWKCFARQRHAGDDYEISRRNQLAILRGVTNCHPTEILTDYVRGQICCGDF